MQLICEVVNRHGGLNRTELAHAVCELLAWQRTGGGLKARECREFLEQLDQQGIVQLPSKRATKPVGSRTCIPVSAEGEPGCPIEGLVGAFEPIVVEPVQTPEQQRS